jgi:hypothetical protein
MHPRFVHPGCFIIPASSPAPPVAAAGEFKVNGGKLVLISDRSGHYQPKLKFAFQALAEELACLIPQRFHPEPEVRRYLAAVAYAVTESIVGIADADTTTAARSQDQ